MWVRSMRPSSRTRSRPRRSSPPPSRRRAGACAASPMRACRTSCHPRDIAGIGPGLDRLPHDIRLGPQVREPRAALRRLLRPGRAAAGRRRDVVSRRTIGPCRRRPVIERDTRHRIGVDDGRRGGRHRLPSVPLQAADRIDGPRHLDTTGRQLPETQRSVIRLVADEDDRIGVRSRAASIAMATNRRPMPAFL